MFLVKSISFAIHRSGLPEYFQHGTGTSKNAPPRDYSLEASHVSRLFSAFTSISIIAAIFGNGILPEIQVMNSFIHIDFLNFMMSIGLR